MRKKTNRSIDSSETFPLISGYYSGDEIPAVTLRLFDSLGVLTSSGWQSLYDSAEGLESALEDADETDCSGSVIIAAEAALAAALKACPEYVVDLHSGEPIDDEEVESDTSHTLEMRDDGGSTETVECDERPSADEIAEACRDWVEGGEWGDDGASVRVHWTLTDAGGEEIDNDIEDIDVEPNHDALIRATGGDADCRHDWTGEGEGGCDENPGVWLTGGTSMMFREHCQHCGLIRTVTDPGSQRNPGEHPTVSYSLPDDDDA